MRNIPTPARVAIATLYLRLRDARRHAADAADAAGGYSGRAYRSADAEQLTLHNALMAAKANVARSMQPNLRPSAKEFLAMVQKRGERLRSPRLAEAA